MRHDDIVALMNTRSCLWLPQGHLLVGKSPYKVTHVTVLYPVSQTHHRHSRIIGPLSGILLKGIPPDALLECEHCSQSGEKP